MLKKKIIITLKINKEKNNNNLYINIIKKKFYKNDLSYYVKNTEFLKSCKVFWIKKSYYNIC